MINTIDIDFLEPRIFTTKIQVSVLPEDHPEIRNFAVYVEYRGKDLYAVSDGFGQALSASNTWDHEPSPSSRTDEYIRSHRFSYEEALRKAKELSKSLVVNGISVAEILTMDTLDESQVEEYIRNCKYNRSVAHSAKVYGPFASPEDRSAEALTQVADLIVRLSGWKEPQSEARVRRFVKDVTGWDDDGFDAAIDFALTLGNIQVSDDGTKITVVNF